MTAEPDLSLAVTQLMKGGRAADRGGTGMTGFRLARLELYNWGTFSGDVKSLALNEQNTLLTGDIGSGKSTIVDAVTTLLLPAQRISYNKAAGADTRERSLRSYVLGYYKTERNEVTGATRPVPLRSNSDYSVLLGVFTNPDYDATVSLAQVFWLRNGDAGQPDRFYVTADRALSVSRDLAGFGSDAEMNLHVELAGHGGNRLTEIDRQLTECDEARQARMAKAERFAELLASANLAPVATAEQFAVRRREITAAWDVVRQDRAEHQNALTETGVRAKALQGEGAEVNAELRSLQERKTSIPRKQLDLRTWLCRELAIEEESLPFAGELIAVRDSEADWEGAAERVLHGFALSNRYGFLRRPGYVRFRVPGGYRGFSELSVRAAEFIAVPEGVSRAYVIENEITYLAFPVPAGAMVIFGSGYSLPFLPLGWLAGLDLTYWGDIDTHGFAILNRLRHHLPNARSMLMDRVTLLDHRDHWTAESTPTAATLDRLDQAESALYAGLVSGAYGRSLRLEQERISFAAVEKAVADG